MIEPASILFLSELAENNDRNWFAENKGRYEQARANVLEFTGKLIKGISAFDSTVPKELSSKDCVMRIYRDIRFSKDKSPFKTNFGIAISANGKNFNGPGYYIHLQPDQSFIAGGSWFPEAPQLKAIRQEIDYNGSEFLEMLREPSFKKHYEDLDREGALKTTPKGYAADHELINYLKLKSFTATCRYNDQELYKETLVDDIVSRLQKIYPLMVFLREAIS